MIVTKKVNSLLLPEVKDILATVDPKFNGRMPYETKIKDWLSPIIDLSDFYVYPVSGITTAIDWWTLNEKRGIYKYDGDYEWVDNTGNEVLYISCPSSIDGNHTTIPTDVPVVLDLAYVGTTSITKIPMTKNIEKVFYSLSKPFGIGNVRTGWYFTRRPDIKLHNLTKEAGYYNYCASQYAEILLDNFDVSYIHNAFHDQQISICSEHGLTPSDSVWLSTSKDSKYQEFRRNSAIARLCITKYMKEWEYDKDHNF